MIYCLVLSTLEVLLLSPPIANSKRLYVSSEDW